MRIAALMSFYDEPADLIFDAVRSLEGFADELVAVDGAYALYFEGTGASPASNREAICSAASEAGVNVTLRQPSEAWEGNEVAKRDAVFRIADTLGVDWFYSVDGDFVSRIKPGTREALGRCAEHVCDVTIVEKLGKHERYIGQPIPLLFRARPGIRVGPTHYHWKIEGDELWTWATANEPHYPHADFTDLVTVLHQSFRRDEDRRSKQWGYYLMRNAQNIEEAPIEARDSAMAEREAV